DMGAMTHDEQSRARDSAIQYLHDRRNPADRVAVMTADNGRVSIVEDFTSDRVRAEGAILQLSAASRNRSAPDVDAIERATQMLAPLPEKKALVYFSSGSAQLGPDNKAQLQRTINKAIKSNLSIYPVGLNGTSPQLLAQSSPAGASAVNPTPVQTAP